MKLYICLNCDDFSTSDAQMLIAHLDKYHYDVLEAAAFELQWRKMVASGIMG